MTTRTPQFPPDNSWAVRLNRWTLGFSRHYLRIILSGLAVYLILPLLAPVLMHLGATGPASLIYNAYSPLCHQFVFRSWFFFGEQAAYPRLSAQVPGLKPFEAIYPDIQQGLTAQYGANRPSITGLPQDMSDAKFYIGDPTYGYKTAVCQRDLAIYFGLLAGGLVYSIPRVRRQLRPVPLLLYIFWGLGPIGLDGFSQLLSQPPFSLWPVRESSPLFRTVTGLLFGLMNAWLAFPYMEASAREVIKEIESKFARRRDRAIVQRSSNNE